MRKAGAGWTIFAAATFFLLRFGSSMRLIDPSISLSSVKRVLKTSFASLITGSALLNGSPAFGAIDSEQQLIDVFERTTPSVVNINTFVERVDVFNMNVMEVPSGTGTGFVWDKDGHIVTNFHVIRNAKSAKVSVTDEDGKTVTTYKAKVAGVDPDKDVAVLEIKTKKQVKWKPITTGTSAGLRVGQTALAIGNPFGLDHTLTTGIVSGVGREMRSPSNKPISNVIQTDAAINPGNSGGPLLDGTGKLIGMNTAIYSASGSSAGIGFAIPVDTLKYEVDTLIREGQVIRPIIGVSYLDSSQAKLLGVQKGILVLSAPDGSPAQIAGIRGTTRGKNGELIFGDIIVGINSDAINNENDLFKAIEKYRVGDVVTIKIQRLKAPVPAENIDKSITSEDEDSEADEGVIRSTRDLSKSELVQVKVKLSQAPPPSFS